MDTELLKAAKRGDESLVENLLARSAITIADHNGDARSAQDRATNTVSILLGVTIGGNTALHIAATHGHLKLTEMICKKESSLVVARNVMRETPLHCAARAGHHQIVESIISFTRYSKEIEFDTVLRARNQDWATALHEAARNGHVEVAKLLVSADPGLANMVDEEGISPLYLAAMVGPLPLIRAILPPSSTTTTTAAFSVSYAGPKGQTALHAAVFLRNSEIVQKLLEWNKMLARHTDNSGSTPLHYAASSGNDRMIKLLLEHDTSSAYIADSHGLFPVHVAAVRGKKSIIHKLIEDCPDSDELVDKNGRNLLHTAVQSGKIEIVWYVCQMPEFAKLMNASDFEGNTPLHLAVKKENQEIVGLLMRDKKVNSNIMNKEGLTPLDLSIRAVGNDLNYFNPLYWMNPSFWILRCLLHTGSLGSPRRLDHFRDDIIARTDLKKESEDLKKESEDLKKESENLEKYQHMNQIVIVSSVFIATVTFAAVFTLPWGYKDEGKPVIAGNYIFKAFVIADILAFILSVLSASCSTISGSVLLHSRFRSCYITFSFFLLILASRCMIVAFALAIYLVLAPVSKSISIVVFVATFNSLLVTIPDKMQIYRFVRTIKSRVGWAGLYKSCARRQHEGWVNKCVYFSIALDISTLILDALLVYIFIFPLALLK